MVEIDLLRTLAPPVQPRPADRTRARVSLEAVASGRRPPVTKRAARRQRVVRIGMVTVLVVALGVSSVVLPGSGGGSGGPMMSSAQALVLPDGTTLGRRRITKYILDGRTAELRERLGRYGISIEVTEEAVHPDVAGELLGWEFYPADPEAAASEPFDQTWDVDETDVGSLLKVRMGRAPQEGEAYSTAGLGAFQIHPELCDAVVFDDPAQTHRNLVALGFNVEWATLTSDPSEPGYDPPNGARDEPPPSGEIYAIFAGAKKIWDAGDVPRGGLSIEVLETEDSGPAPTRPSYCDTGS